MSSPVSLDQPVSLYLPVSLHLIIPAIGEPFYDNKLDILRKILTSLTRSSSVRVSIECFLYTCSPVLHNQLLSLLRAFVPAERIRVRTAAGYLGGFIYKYVKPLALLNVVDYMMFLLDDIELPPDFDVHAWIQCYVKYNLDVLSPGVKAGCASQDIMKKQKEDAQEVSQNLAQEVAQNVTQLSPIRDVNFCEFFCYLMTPQVYARYYTLLDENTQTLWGVDLLMHSLGLSMAVHNHVEMEHMFTRASTGGYKLVDAERELHALLRKHAHLTPVYSNQTLVLSHR